MSAEAVREFYRRQGEERERERIKKQLQEYGEDPIASKLDDFIRLAIDAESNGSLAKGCEWGAKDERARIIKLLKEQKVIRNCGAFGSLVFVNCDTLEVLYLKDDLMNESAA